MYRHLDLADTTPYSFEVSDDFVVDALHHGNVSRFINDPRGTPTSTPNVGASEVNFSAKRLSTVVFTTTRDVAVGAELLFDYGDKYSMEMHMKPWEEDATIDVDLIPVKKEVVKRHREEKSYTRKLAIRNDGQFNVLYTYYEGW